MQGSTKIKKVVFRGVTFKASRWLVSEGKKDVADENAHQKCMYAQI